MESSIEHIASVTADLNVPEEVTLYDNDGDAIRVPAAKAGKYLAQGFRRTRLDLDATLADAKALFAPTEAALDAYIADVKASGFVNTHHEASRATLLAAWELLNQTLARLVRDSVTLYEEREAA